MSEDTGRPVDRMTADEARAEHARLGAELAEHDRRYHQEDAPTISDAAYDALRRRYNDIEEAFPDLRAAGSRSAKVGAAPSSRFAKVRHAVPMLSLDNAFSDEDVAEFVARVQRFLNLKEPPAFTAEPKIDGLSCSLRYEGGELVAPPRAATARRARMSRPTSARSARFPTGSWAAAFRRSARSAARSISAMPISAHQRGAGETGRQDLRQPAQCRRRQPAPDRRLRDGPPAAPLLRLCLGRDERHAGRDAMGDGAGLRALRPADEPAHEALRHARGDAGGLSPDRGRPRQPRL